MNLNRNLNLRTSNYLVFFFVFISQLCFCQDYDFSGAKSTAADREALLEKIKQERLYFDSIYMARKLDSLELRYNFINTDTSSYFAFTLYLEHIPGDYGQLLQELQANGFDTSEGATGFGYGFTVKKRRLIHEFVFNIMWGDKMKSSDNETVQVRGASFLSYMFGFDLLNSSKFSLYPFVTLSHQSSELQYKRDNSGGVSYNNFLDIPTDVSEITIRNNMLRAGFGGELDYYLPKSNRKGGVIIGFRYGVNTTLVEGSYKFDDEKIDYDPKISLRDSYFTFVIRFYGRTPFKDEERKYRERGTN